MHTNTKAMENTIIFTIHSFFHFLSFFFFSLLLLLFMHSTFHDQNEWLFQRRARLIFAVQDHSDTKSTLKHQQMQMLIAIGYDFWMIITFQYLEVVWCDLCRHRFRLLMAFSNWKCCTCEYSFPLLNPIWSPFLFSFALQKTVSNGYYPYSDDRRQGNNTPNLTDVRNLWTNNNNSLILSPEITYAINKIVVGKNKVQKRYFEMKFDAVVL